MKRLILLACVAALIPLAGCVYRPYGYYDGYYGGRYDGYWADRYGRDYRDRGYDRRGYYDRDYGGRYGYYDR